MVTARMDGGREWSSHPCQNRLRDLVQGDAIVANRSRQERDSVSQTPSRSPTVTEGKLSA